MSKHLRGPRRYTGPRDPQTGADEGVNVVQNEAAQDAASQTVTDGAAVAGFSAQDPAQTESGIGAFSADPQGAAYPNGDDPDRVPVTPELADDEVPNMPGAILKHAREMLGMSQREVASQLMVRVNTVSDIEHDRLNQPTAVQFASQHIESYARLVNIDPQAVLELYRQNVREVQAQALRREAEYHKSEKNPSKGFMKPVIMGLGAVVLLGAGVVIGLSLGSSSEEQESSGALVLDPTAQVQQQMAEDAGALEAPLPPAPAEELPPPPLDPNTEMARQQAIELGTNEIISAVQRPSDSSLKPSDESPTLSVAPAAAPIAPAAKPVEAPAASPAPQAQTEVKVERTQTAVPKQVKNEPKAEPKTVQTAPVKTAEAEAPAPKLGAVRDITSSARLTNRNDIGSLNSVSVRVNGPVSLRITGNGKVLKSGSFKKGDTVSATGMPPLRVEVTDSALIRVSYNGGTVTVPAGKNVGYDLPTR